MYPFLVSAHSYLRFILLALLILVVLKSLMGWMNKKPFASIDNKLSLWLLIATHLQLVAGLVLYFLSDSVRFTAATMKDAHLRYWTVEHVFMMLIAIVLITVARITHKKLPTDQAKHKRLFLFNAIALIIIVAAIIASGRGLLIPTRME